MAKESIGDTVTTLALGEESRVKPGTVTSLAIGEEDPPPPEPKPPSKTATIPGDNPLGAW